MTWHVGVGGAWKAVANAWVGVGGAWKPVSRIDNGVSGAWKNSFAAVTLDSVYNVTHSPTSPTVAFAKFEINVDGHLYRTLGSTVTDLGTWTLPGTDTSQYIVVAELVSGEVSSGGFPPGGAELTFSRQWSVQEALAGQEQSAVISLAIRFFGTGADLATSTLNLTAEVIP